ncbi:hypothetical protein KUV85_01870 [Nocardioides panacisoli]|uniref:YncE family protein n=1 Tax=Nocardioides panacisoli TaxID=627624 RepID=UPI001C63A26A|nr:hypothetical protein [Nocardioides panacisoli]QYJ04449.1 hypothetical protein KUV85_01870 [Nocardioides panacisoli]
MSDHLQDLLAREADRVDVPAPPTRDVVRRGRAIRRRRRALGGVAAVAALGLVGGAVHGLGSLTDSARTVDPASPLPAGPVYAVGNEVTYAGGRASGTVEDPAVKSLYYTSVGILVRHGENALSDGGGPQRFSLLGADGSVTRLALTTRDAVHATDPSLPYVAYAEEVDGVLEAVVRDVGVDEEVARVSVGPTRAEGFPVSLDGDLLYVSEGYGGEVHAVDWRNGSVADSGLPGVDDVAGGLVTSWEGGVPMVVDVATGATVLSSEAPGYFDLSPGGRHAMFVDEDAEADVDTASVEVYDVASGEHVTLDGPGYEWGWTPDGDPFRIDRESGELTTCVASTGDCTSTDIDLPPASGCARSTVNSAATPPCEETGDDLRLGGRAYES